MIAGDRGSLFANGVTLAGRKCTVLRDALNVDGQHTMDIKMKTSEKEPDPFSFTIGRSHKGETRCDKAENMCGYITNYTLFYTLQDVEHHTLQNVSVLLDILNIIIIYYIVVYIHI